MGHHQGHDRHPDGHRSAGRRPTARLLTRDAATHWLTEATMTGIGQAVAVAITRYRPQTRGTADLGEALSGVDHDLLTPLTILPPGWPLPPAAWRRDLRTRLMDRLRHAGWVTYSTRPPSLQIGARGRAWLTATAQTHLDRPHTLS